MMIKPKAILIIEKKYNEIGRIKTRCKRNFGRLKVGIAEALYKIKVKIPLLYCRQTKIHQYVYREKEITKRGNT